MCATESDSRALLLLPAVLKRSLYECFAQFGPVLDVVCMKTIKMRGQAFVVFKDVTAATNAIKGMQGFPFFGNEMHITFAKGKSDCVANGQPDSPFIRADVRRDSFTYERMHRRHPDAGTYINADVIADARADVITDI